MANGKEQLNTIETRKKKTMTKTKNVQIPYELFMELLQYFYFDVEKEISEEKLNYFKNELSKKLKKLYEHDRYSAAKTSETPEEKEKAFQEYLKSISSNHRA